MIIQYDSPIHQHKAFESSLLHTTGWCIVPTMIFLDDFQHHWGTYSNQAWPQGHYMEQFSKEEPLASETSAQPNLVLVKTMYSFSNDTSF